MRHYNGFWIRPMISGGGIDTGCVAYEVLNDRMSCAAPISGARFPTETAAITAIDLGQFDHERSSLTVATGTADGAQENFMIEIPGPKPDEKPIEPFFKLGQITWRTRRK